MQAAYLKSNKPISGLTKIFILLIPLIIIAVFIAFFTSIFITLIVCLLFALVLNPLVDYIQGLVINRTLSILLVYAVLSLLLFFAVKIIVPNVIEQADSLKDSYKKLKLSDKITSAEKWVEKNVPYLKREDITREAENSIKSSFTRVQDLISNVLSTAFLIIIIPFVTFFILRDRQKIKNGFISLVPNKYFEMTINIIDKIEKQLSRYVRAWLLDALFVGVCVFTGLSILGINNSIIIGMVAGVGHLIPYAGPIIGGVPALLISIIQFGDLRMLLPIILMVAIIYVIDNSVFQPYVFSKSTDMNPITIIILILLGNEIMGAFGALMAIPLATILTVSARETIRGFRNYKLGYY